jgi:hypothetical protein
VPSGMPKRSDNTRISRFRPLAGPSAREGPAPNCEIEPASGGEVQYEYKTVVLSGGFVGLHKEELDRADLDRQLGELGAEGWDLCWALMDQTLRIENDGHVLVFKRLVEEEFEDVEEEEPDEDEPVEDERAEEEPAEEEPDEEEPADEEPLPTKNLPRKSPPTTRPKNCVECGKSLRGGAKFCGVCGTQVDA